MGQYVTLQKKITVAGDTTSEDYNETQPMGTFLDVAGWDAAFVTLHTLTVTKATNDTVELSLGTADKERTEGMDIAPNGPAGPCVAFSGVASNQWYKAFIGFGDEPQGTGTYRLENMLGWHVNVNNNDTTGGTFRVTFECFVTLKRPS